MKLVWTIVVASVSLAAFAAPVRGLPPSALPRAMSMWRLYVGGGPALNIFRFSDDTEPEGGFSGLVGLAHAKGLFVEAKVGALRSPSFKFGVGYTFHP